MKKYNNILKRKNDLDQLKNSNYLKSYNEYYKKATGGPYIENPTVPRKLDPSIIKSSREFTSSNIDGKYRNSVNSFVKDTNPITGYYRTISTDESSNPRFFKKGNKIKFNQEANYYDNEGNLLTSDTAKTNWRGKIKRKFKDYRD